MNEVDFAFAWEGAKHGSPWSSLSVVEVRGTEAMNELYRYELVLLARDSQAEADPEDLVGSRATLRIKTGTEPTYRVVHGLIGEAEELGPVDDGMMYRVVLWPPLVRAQHRTRCRIFLEKTTRQIIDAVLTGDPALKRDDAMSVEPHEGGTDFTPAAELYAWRVNDVSRIDAPDTRSYCVQYNESDFAFISRILEEEGISYHFEHGEDACLLVLSDADAGRSWLEPFEPLSPALIKRNVRSMKLGARLRPRKVSLLDYNWKKPALGMAVTVPEQPAGSDLVDHAYPGLYPDTPDQGRPLAQARLDRLSVEARYAVGQSSCRLLGAGTIFELEHPISRYEGQYLITRIEIHGEQGGAVGAHGGGRSGGPGITYDASFECARRGRNGAVEESRFRPARTTPKPRVHGTQTAFVTAEPATLGSEIHVGGPAGAEIGCVRLKFHWDTETDRHAREPTSCWVRVNQVFAGVGEGAVFHPRVGVEAIVDFEEGDPDRPIVVGRVYNGQNQPPAGAPTVSTLKSMTSPGGGSHNELRFDDTAGAQQILLHTPMNWNSEVGNDRSEQVACMSASSVGLNRTESTGVDRSTLVGGNNSEMIAANESVTIGVNQTVSIGVDQAVTIGANQAVTILADQTLAVTGNQTEAVTGDRGIQVTGNDTLAVTGTRAISVTGAQSVALAATHDVAVAGNETVRVGGQQAVEVAGSQGLVSATSQLLQAPSQAIAAEADQVLTSTVLQLSAASAAQLQSALVDILGSSAVQITAGQLVIASGPVAITGGDISISGGTISMSTGMMSVDGGGLINMSAGLIKLN